MPNWETFRGRGASVVKKPYITLQKSGALALSKPAHEMLGRPTHAELLYDPTERIVGVRPVPAGVEHAYPLRHTETNPNQYLISGVAFLKYYDLDVKISRRYPAYLDDGVLCIDLKTSGTKVVGNRNGVSTLPAWSCHDRADGRGVGSRVSRPPPGTAVYRVPRTKPRSAVEGCGETPGQAAGLMILPESPARSRPRRRCAWFPPDGRPPATRRGALRDRSALVLARLSLLANSTPLRAPSGGGRAECAHCHFQ